MRVGNCARHDSLPRGREEGHVDCWWLVCVLRHRVRHVVVRLAEVHRSVRFGAVLAPQREHGLADVFARVAVQ
eukprot:6116565-Prymnesium_polylepis.1